MLPTKETKAVNKAGIKLLEATHTENGEHFVVVWDGQHVILVLKTDFVESEWVVPALEAPAPSRLKFRHYKGGRYEVLYEALQPETSELFVIYQGETGDWARPKPMFLDQVEFEGKMTLRFEPLDMDGNAIDEDVTA